MTRPRKPFGANQPGRLQSTMMKVLAAEMSDPQRSRKGKRYAADGSVLDIEIETGLVTAEVQGSRATPYVAMLEVSPGDGMPLRRDLHATCTCPDDDGWNDRICKHVVALMYVFADELLIEPELLDLWRDNTGAESDPSDRADSPDTDPADRTGDDNDPTSADRTGQRRHLRLVTDGIEQARAERRAGRSADRGVDADDDTDRPAEPDPIIDPLMHALAVPEGRTIPVVPVLDPADLPLPRRPELAAALRAALGEVRIDWD